MQEYTLVVVDMQPDFEASCHLPTLNAVEREVCLAKRRGYAVVVLEIPRADGGEGRRYRPTHQRIMRHLDGYGRLQVVQKLESDGSYQLITTCARNGYTLKRFRVCGVNTDICVLKTVIGLSETLPACTIKVVKDACNSSYEPDCWRVFRLLENVETVRPRPKHAKPRLRKSAGKP